MTAPKDSIAQVIDTVEPRFRSFDTTTTPVRGLRLVTAKAVGAALVAAFVLSCNGADTAALDRIPASLTVTPASLSLPVGGNATLTSSVRDAEGSPISGIAVSWSSENSSIASVTAGSEGAAVVAAVAGGSTDIRAVASKSGSEVTATVPTQVTGGTTVASVVVSPSQLTLTAPNGTRQLTATAYDAGGNVVTGISFRWTSSNPGVADVNNNGLVLAKAAGTAVITAVAICCGAGGTTSIDVENPPDGQPNLVEDFSTYSSTANMMSDPRGIYADAADIQSAGTITLDTSDGYGTLTQSMKYTWTSYSSPGGGGTITRKIEYGAHSRTWVEWAVKFSSNFSVANGFTGGAAYKYIFGIGPRIGHGWTLEMVGSGGRLDAYYSDQSGGTGEYFAHSGINLSNLADDTWHVFRMYVDVDNPTFTVWLDGTQIANLTNWSPSSSFRAMSLGKNINMRPVDHVQTLNWGYLKFWFDSNDPGW